MFVDGHGEDVCAWWYVMVGVVFMLSVIIIIIVGIDLFWLHHHVTSPILTRPRVHTDNGLGAEGATALVPALKLLTGLQTLNLAGTSPPLTR